ncbi:MAG: guanylate kinase [Puniceicoccales bacterium]|jgi:guanylate kinase|nr:guanylate kinase [Puniceicoccales bacterium]
MADLGKIFLICGPAGVGKSTVCQRLLAHFPEHLRRITTATTRAPRPDEVNDVDYCFIDEATFLKYIAEDKFLEYANVHKKYFYGTPIAPVLSNMRHGIDSLLIVDVQGIRSIRQRLHHLSRLIVTIFIMPEDLGVLEQRLHLRHSESTENLAWRLQSAKHEIKFAKHCDYIVLSGSKEEDFLSMESIYRREHTVQEKASLDFLRFIYDGKQLILQR